MTDTHCNSMSEEHEYLQRKVASAETMLTMLSAPVGDNGRGSWSLFRLPNGDLLFGAFPHGDTYMQVSESEDF